MTRSGRARPSRIRDLRLAAVLGLAAIAVAGCAPGDGPRRTGDPDLDADIRVSPTPAVTGESRVFVRATDGGAPLAGARVTIHAEAVDTAGSRAPSPPGAFPPATEHPMPEVEGAAGDYGPIVLHFPAPGRWRIEVTIRESARETSISVPLAVVGGPQG
jgi:hypothetical protein